jgi:hypothetical protein
VYAAIWTTSQPRWCPVSYLPSIAADDMSDPV